MAGRNGIIEYRPLDLDLTRQNISSGKKTTTAAGIEQAWRRHGRTKESSSELSDLGLQSTVRQTKSTGRERRGWGTHPNRKKRAGNDVGCAALDEPRWLSQACGGARVRRLRALWRGRNLAARRDKEAERD